MNANNISRWVANERKEQQQQLTILKLNRDQRCWQQF